MVNEMENKSKSKFIKSHANRHVMNRYRHALEEIFDVLKLSEEFEKRKSRDMPSFSNGQKIEHVDLLNDDINLSHKKTDREVEISPFGDLFVDDLHKKNSSALYQPPTVQDDSYPLLNLSDIEVPSSTPNLLDFGDNNADIKLHSGTTIQPATKFVTIHSNATQSSPDTIDVKFVNPFLLKPKLLADNIAYALNSFINEKKLFISKAEFVTKMLQLMFDGKLTPFGYLLTPTEKRNNRKSKHSLRRTEDIEVETHCTHHPKLKAGDMSTALTEQRYSDRYKGSIKIEDSLLSCMCICLFLPPYNIQSYYYFW